MLSAVKRLSFVVCGALVFIIPNAGMSRPRITDFEASRLTLAALTSVSAPIHHSPLLRYMHHSHYGSGPHFVASSVRLVSYRVHHGKEHKHHCRG